MEEGPAEIYFRGSFCEEKVRRKALARLFGKGGKYDESHDVSVF